MEPVTMAFYILGSLAAAKALATKPPEGSKLTTSAPAAGGSTQPMAQDIFQQGQRQAPSAVPPGIVAPTDPTVASGAQALALGAPYSTQAIGQNIVDSAIQQGYAPQVPNSPMPPEVPIPGGPSTLGNFLAGLNNAGGAISAMAPLLGFGPEQMRGIHTAGAAGGQPGQPLFQFPQRNTLAQILASLPRIYHG